jgi:hypothetical protein
MAIRVSRQTVEALVVETSNTRISRQSVEALYAEAPNLRTSRQHAEILAIPEPNLRISRQHTEILSIEAPNLRTSRQHIEILGADVFNGRVSRQHVELLTIEDPNLRISRQHVEILAIPEPNLRISKQAVEVLSATTFYILSASSTLNFQQSTDAATNHITVEYYGTIYEANEYFAQRLHERVWSEASPADRVRALWAATLIIDALNYKGQRHPVYEVLQGNPDADAATIRAADASQILEFPRDADTEVPEEVRLATYEIAQALLDGKDPELELETLGIVSQGFQSVRTSYSRNQVPIDHIINGVPSPQAWRWLRPLLRDDDATTLSRIS